MVLVLAGHDPTGGAGLVADAESVAACGGWALTVPTALTVQDLVDVQAVHPVPASTIRQAAAALESLPIAAIKIGLIADLEALDAVVDVVRRRPGVPVVADPVLKAGGGSPLATQELIDAYFERLLPRVDILTPNRGELARLAGLDYQDDTERCVSLMHQGCQAVLVTGTDDPEGQTAKGRVAHTLHTPDSDRQWTWPRLPATFHGSGCTLAAAVATRLAAGESLVQACEQAQVFAWQALAHGWTPGQGQSLPRRLWKMPTPRFSPDEVKV
ncbi:MULTISPECIES: hydroxymethylpyrimidine/phosphomethylpyrimidine kinase [Halomonas]|uniref:hydroxymethylpyrimidine kinase n=1 Tax=Halomonas litopenaei TaxID=2109328 RepID=A0ABX5IWU3_9GAMM|nr:MULTISPECIES: hydroxymethylpyrimidine/phosphomethylpyrimidine kinase [Halomonas]MCO7213827.1 hydroxymethylpyrimidine/phosphomethylpyrimidine kinase [Halomonas sp. OfavH-34-E]PTL91463.1 hydroxymethylpyrimidine/phosphomethylpyrimidine kinase [Halomonas sp. SYSU XM8]PTL95059.1 hydroxymethylpyrimidine/phosphomethylpyrimidine kinase [Halomonas litopenaei]RQW70479.1 hydroxymethylpyrimidine/phosphomethylpyrimidine kinase [Halomonas sp. YLB-10]